MHLHHACANLLRYRLHRHPLSSQRLHVYAPGRRDLRLLLGREVATIQIETLLESLGEKFPQATHRLPARAGARSVTFVTDNTLRAAPRVCGREVDANYNIIIPDGSSPRARARA